MDLVYNILFYFLEALGSLLLKMLNIEKDLIRFPCFQFHAPLHSGLRITLTAGFMGYVILKNYTKTEKYHGVNSSSKCDSVKKDLIG